MVQYRQEVQEILGQEAQRVQVVQEILVQEAQEAQEAQEGLRVLEVQEILVQKEIHSADLDLLETQVQIYL
mgnify:CR=1 FL=1